ncbi:FkbM family methyltransferase [Ferruginibacter sp.]|nr:FkbM family methyltransferase [Ferruginibacter sp.]
MRKIIRRLFNKFGYEIIRTSTEYRGDRNKTHKVNVGNFILSMPGNNPLVRHYERFPKYNIKLGQLAGIILKKYPDAVMLDVGANVGDTVAVVRSAVNIPIIAVEGDEFTYSFLQKNAPLFEQLEIINQFLGEESKEQSVDMLKEGWNTTIIPKESNSGNSKVLNFKTLDDVLTVSKFGRSKKVKLIKVDAEGYDTIILRGALKTIAEFKPVLFFEYNRENMDTIGEMGLPTLFSMANYGYDRIAILDNHNRCVVHTTLSQKDIIKQLHDYADGEKGLIPHYDICIFHSLDSDILDEFLNFPPEN